MRIGNVKLDNPFIAAPLAGITDAPTRSLCKSMGAALVYSEMVSGKGLMYGNRNTEKLLKIYENEKPIAYQIFGADPEVMGWTAKELSKRENAILDINMGCPVPKVVKNGEGSALLKDLDLLYQVTEAVVKNADKPVTAKIRIGWDEKSIVAVQVAKTLESAGVSGVVVHGRTREQYYSGVANWHEIAKVKKAISIPVIGNGDVFSGQDALDIMDQTGCDFAMIGRGMLGNPWIFRDALALWQGEEVPPTPTRKEKINIMLVHFKLLLKENGEYSAVREMRKHVGWYLKGEPGATKIRHEINHITEAEIMVKAIKNM